MTTALFLLRCLQIGLSLRDLDLLTIGMVNEMYIESGNDQHQSSYKEGDCLLQSSSFALHKETQTNQERGGRPEML